MPTSGRLKDVNLLRTDTTLDLSQEAEKVALSIRCVVTRFESLGRNLVKLLLG